MLLPRESQASTGLLTVEIQRYIHTREWPSGLQIRLIEQEGYVQFVLFRDNFNAFDGEDKKQIAAMVKESMEKVRADGIPIYMEVRATREVRDP